MQEKRCDYCGWFRACKKCSERYANLDQGIDHLEKEELLKNEKKK